MTHKLLKYYIILFFFTIFLPGKLSSQDLPDFERKIIRDSLGNLIINAEKPMQLHVSDNPDGENSVKLQAEKPNDTPLIFQSSGKHKLTHLNTYLNKNIPFFFTVDATAPTTQWDPDLPMFSEQDTIYGGKNFTIYLHSYDEYSGVNKTYYSINGHDYEIYDDNLLLKDEDYYEIKFFAVDNVGNVELPKKIKVVTDHTAPESQLEIIGDQHENIISPRSKISLEAHDKTGVKNIRYSINDEPDTEYSQKISVNHLYEGYHTINYYAEDKVGNKEQVQSYEFFVDKTPPIIIEEIIGDSFVAGGKEYSSGRSQLRITAVDNKAGVKEIYYSINDQEYVLYERPVFLSDHSGEINIKTYALDKVNNKNESRAFQDGEDHIPYVDLNAPEISHEIEGPNIFLRDTLFTNNLSKIKLNAEDRNSGVNRIIYRVNQSEEQLFENPFNINKPGYHQINYIAYDNVENSNNDSFNIFVDLQGPEINHNFSIKSYDTINNNGESFKAYPPHVKIYISATDEKTGTKNIFYTINDDKEQEYSNPITGFEKGKLNNIAIRAVDMLGNETIEEISFYLPE